MYKTYIDPIGMDSLWLWLSLLSFWPKTSSSFGFSVGSRLGGPESERPWSDLCAWRSGWSELHGILWWNAMVGSRLQRQGRFRFQVCILKNGAWNIYHSLSEAGKDRHVFFRILWTQFWQELLAKLNKMFKVSGIPSLIILDSNGKLITKEGRQAVSKDPQGHEMPWQLGNSFSWMAGCSRMLKFDFDSELHRNCEWFASISFN